MSQDQELENAKRDINLRVLKKYESRISNILQTTSHVVLYDFDAQSQQWVRNYGSDLDYIGLYIEYRIIYYWISDYMLEKDGLANHHWQSTKLVAKRQRKLYLYCSLDLITCKVIGKKT